MRVYELAKEYEIKATEFVDIIQGFGIGVNSHMSGLDDKQVAEVRNQMDIREQVKIAQEYLEPEPEPEPIEPKVIDTPKVETVVRNTEFIENLQIKTEEQEVIIDKPKGFFGWIRSLFS